MTVIRSKMFGGSLALAIMLATAAGARAGDGPALQDDGNVHAELARASRSKHETAQKADAASSPTVAVPPPADHAPMGGTPGGTGAEAVAPEDGKSPIRTLGEADQKIFVVNHDGLWSMHLENVTVQNVVRLWQEAGGPAITTKLPVDRTFTMSVHKLAPELILERLFEGYGYTLHYDDAGRLGSVRVYSPRESFAFKTPRLTETLSHWKEIETNPDAAAGNPEPQTP